MKVISSSKNFNVVAVRNKCFSNLVNLFRFLGLSSALTKDHIAVNIESSFVFNVAFNSNQASLLRVLKVVTMPFCNFTIDSLFDPGYFINHPIKTELFII